jgi:1-acyl-sn-glycerol-3-phosphate acyltransferase
MMESINRFFRGVVVLGFHVASKVMRHRPHLKGREHLKLVPTPLIFTLTHDSYFEVPSLSRVYYGLRPKPDFLILAKSDFLSGRYLCSNFGGKSRLVKLVLTLLDKTQLPLLIFKILKLTTIHRPFIESYQKKKDEIKSEIGEQMKGIRDRISMGLSTVVFPEGTTWGFGGLKQIRSSVYQLVENALKYSRTKVYILPINVKVDRLVQGKKDIFINVGKPMFFWQSKEKFNKRLTRVLHQLHTVTFSQIAAFTMQRLAESGREANLRIELARDKFSEAVESLVEEINGLVDRHVIPEIDRRLSDKKYLHKKIGQFIKFCKKREYLLVRRASKDGEKLVLNIEQIMATYPAKLYRKLNPLGFSANEFTSICAGKIRSAVESRLSACLKSVNTTPCR